MAERVGARVKAFFGVWYQKLILTLNNISVCQHHAGGKATEETVARTLRVMC